MQVTSLGGAFYFFNFKYDYSGYRTVRFLKLKSEVAQCFQEYVSQLHTETGQLVCILRTDNGGEYEDTTFQSWLRKKGIRHETSAPRTPQQNGDAERDNRTIVEAARTYLYANRAFPLELWAEAVHCATYVSNRVLSSTCTGITPYEAWYKRKPDVSTLGIFYSYV